VEHRHAQQIERARGYADIDSSVATDQRAEREFGDTWRVIVEWDPAKAASNLRKHRVDFREAVTALEDPLSTTFRDPEHSLEDSRFVTIGESANGRILVVAHGPSRSGSHHQREASNPARAQVL
jgi:uncharacterized DUF497 family protein